MKKKKWTQSVQKLKEEGTEEEGGSRGGRQESVINVLGVNAWSHKPLAKTLQKLDLIMFCFPESSF